MPKSKFSFAYSDDYNSSEFVAPVGDGTLPVFEYQKNDDGLEELVCVGRSSIYELIQSHKHDSDLAMLFDRVVNGDTALAMSMSDDGKHGVDLVGMPVDILGMHDLSRDADTFLHSLSSEQISVLKDKGVDGFAAFILEQAVAAKAAVKEVPTSDIKEVLTSDVKGGVKYE